MDNCLTCGGQLPRNSKYATCWKCRRDAKLAADQAVVMAAMKQGGLLATQQWIVDVTGLDVFRVNQVIASLVEAGLAAPRKGGAKYLLTEKAMEATNG